jgi:carboxypeptidase C (cathepsin A)
MFAVIAIFFALLSFGQGEDQGRRQQPPGQQPTPTPQVSASPSSSGAQTAQQRSPQERPVQPAEEPPIVTRPEIKATGRTLRYTATVGMMTIKNRDGEIEARIFFMAYTKPGT